MLAAYTIKPITPLFAAFVSGIDLNQTQPEHVVQKIIDDTYKYGLLIFESQNKIFPDRQLEISRWFGEIESTFYHHPKSPHRDIFRVSNDEKEGCRNVGISGWHIDGTFLEKPFKIQTMHFWSVSKEGATEFVPLKGVIASLPSGYA